MTSETSGIHVSSPTFREEVAVTRGEQTLYFVKYEDDTRYIVIDEFGNGTGHSWRGDVEGISDFHAINAMFDDTYGKEEGA